MAFDIPAILAELRGEPTWQTADRNAITLLKTRGMRVVLVAMHAGTIVRTHHAEGPIALQTLEGRLRFRTDAQEETLGPGALLTLHAGIPHALEAVEDCAYLLTIAGEGAHPAEAHRGDHHG
ncbi:MAG TPA: cupin domain-containing protein [Candidatus Binatia bacterium]|nr:cupin domain-containing protein [Candidatus Binatia bacterium]